MNAYYVLRVYSFNLCRLMFLNFKLMYLGMYRRMVSGGELSFWRVELVSRMFCSGLAKCWLGGVLSS